MLTYNSVEPCLPETLQSLLNSSNRSDINIRLIVIDKDSTDGTIDLMKRFSELNPVILKDIKGNRATARQLGIENVKTPIFLFLDSDIILPEDWFEDALPYFDNDNVGALWGYTIPIKPEAVEYNKKLQQIYNIDDKETRLKYASRRGLTHDTLIRAEAVRDIKIPEELHVLEDHYIRKYIESKGYEWVNSNNKPYCYHFRKEGVGSNAYLDSYYGYYLKIYPLSWFLRHLFLFPLKLLYILLLSRDLNLTKTEGKKEINYLKALKQIIYDHILDNTKKYSFYKNTKNINKKN
jgi:glycosyltransferase involved in cell wall biosynthesis